MEKIVVKDKDGNEIVIEDIQAYYDAHEKAKADLVALRSENKDLKANQDDGTADEKVAEWKKRAIRAEAKVALEETGVKNADRILKYANLDSVDFDEEGNLTGLDESIDSIKQDFPELFDKKRRAGSSSADIHADNPASAQKSLTEMQVDAILG